MAFTHAPRRHLPSPGRSPRPAPATRHVHVHAALRDPVRALKSPYEGVSRGAIRRRTAASSPHSIFHDRGSRSRRLLAVGRRLSPAARRCPPPLPRRPPAARPPLASCCLSSRSYSIVRARRRRRRRRRPVKWDRGPRWNLWSFPPSLAFPASSVFRMSVRLSFRPSPVFPGVHEPSSLALGKSPFLTRGICGLHRQRDCGVSI